jgi:hypothetical protein
MLPISTNCPRFNSLPSRLSRKNTVIQRRFLLAPLLLLLLTTVARADDPIEIKLPPKENFHLFLLVGQSNMAGRGKIAGEDREPHPRVLTFTKANNWAPAVDPLHFDKASAGVGIGRTFGIEIASASTDITIGLIPCAAGGSPISSWEPGGYHSQTKSHPYDDAIKRAKEAIKVGVLKGILWHQGESDSKPGPAEVHGQKLHELIARFRDTLNVPDVPFIAGQMGQFDERPWSDAKKHVDAAHQGLPAKIPHTAFVSSDGLAHKGDEVHFSTPAYRELGRRYAEAYQKLTQSP